MMTSNFRTVGCVCAAGLEPVAISRGVPGWYYGHCYLPLAPTRAMLALPSEEFWPAYADRLAGLDPARVAADLGERAVLLCWEPAGQPCHRRAVAEWLERNLGISVPEFQPPQTRSPARRRRPLAQ